MGTDLGGAVDIVQTTSYYPFGLVMNQYNGNTAPDYQKNKYLYNGKELQDDVFAGSSLNWFDYGARMYDPQIGRYHVQDLLAEKYYSLSPYNYVGNSPIMRIDLLGLDWYTDKDKSYQYDPNVTKDSKLKDGQTYVGKTYEVKDKNGNLITRYREDGSIFFTKDKDAINRISENDKKYDKEELGIFTDGGILVTPDYKNTKSECTPTGKEKYNYELEDNILTDASGNSFNVHGSIHTHFGDADPYPSGTTGFVGDLQYFSRRTPNKPVLTLDENGKIEGLIGKYTPEGNNRWGWLPRMSLSDFKNDQDLRQKISKYFVK